MIPMPLLVIIPSITQAHHTIERPYSNHCHVVASLGHKLNQQDPTRHTHFRLLSVISSLKQVKEHYQLDGQSTHGSAPRSYTRPASDHRCHRPISVGSTLLNLSNFSIHKQASLLVVWRNIAANSTRVTSSRSKTSIWYCPHGPSRSALVA